MKSKFVEGIQIEKQGFDFVDNFEIEVLWGMTLREICQYITEDSGSARRCQEIMG